MNRSSSVPPAIDPCINCSIGQDCCSNLQGLKLLESEYEAHFARHRDELRVERLGGLYVVSAREGKSCPNWKDGRCSVHDTRPIECRLFPYTIGAVTERDRRVLLTFHSRTRCPNKHLLLAKPQAARDMVLSFGRQAFGDGRGLDVKHDGRSHLRVMLLDHLRWLAGRIWRPLSGSSRR